MEQRGEAAIATTEGVDMQFEVVVIRCPTSIAQSFSTRISVGGLMPISRTARLSRNSVHAARLFLSVIFGKNVTAAAPGSAQGSI